MLEQRDIDGIRYFVFPDLERNSHFTHAITARQPFPDPDGKEMAPFRLLERFGVPGDRLVLLQQVHGPESIVLGQETGALPPGHRPEADGIILTSPGYYGVIRTADCVPVIAELPNRRAVGLFHSGWRGTCARVVELGLRRLLEVTGADAAELLVAIGPAIRACCYEVGPEVLETFEEAGHPLDGLFDGGRLDLPEAVRRQALAVGAVNILDSGMCTVCRNDLFYSYRKEKTALRTWTVAGWDSRSADPLGQPVPRS